MSKKKNRGINRKGEVEGKILKGVVNFNNPKNCKNGFFNKMDPGEVYEHVF